MFSSYRFALASLALCVLARAMPEPKPDPAPVPPDPKAVALLEAAAKRIQSVNTLVATYCTMPAGAPFHPQGEITLSRPNRFKVEEIKGVAALRRTLVALSDGEHVVRIDRFNHIIYKRPVRPADFADGVNAIVSYFFNPAVGFDPTDGVWGHSISIFDSNRDAYNRYVTIRYMGEAVVDGVKVEQVRVRFNSRTENLEQLYSFADGLLLQVDTNDGPMVRSIRLRDPKVDPVLPPDTFVFVPPKGVPVQDAEPVRLGEVAPDFELPLNTGKTIKLKELLKGKRGVLISCLDGTAGYGAAGPDAYLRQMKLLQSIRDKYTAQGLEVVVVVGSAYVTPDVKDEMMRNWMPDTSRFNYPIAIDIDLERGIQGSAYVNFNLNGRNNVLIDSEGRVAFACHNFDRMRINELALYQALGQIGFAVSPAELESVLR